MKKRSRNTLGKVSRDRPRRWGNVLKRKCGKWGTTRSIVDSLLARIALLLMRKADWFKRIWLSRDNKSMVFPVPPRIVVNTLQRGWGEPETNAKSGRILDKKISWVDKTPEKAVKVDRQKKALPMLLQASMKTVQTLEATISVLQMLEQEIVML